MKRYKHYSGDFTNIKALQTGLDNFLDNCLSWYKDFFPPYMLVTFVQVHVQCAECGILQSLTLLILKLIFNNRNHQCSHSVTLHGAPLQIKKWALCRLSMCNKVKLDTKRLTFPSTPRRNRSGCTRCWSANITHFTCNFQTILLMPDIFLNNVYILPSHTMVPTHHMLSL